MHCDHTLHVSADFEFTVGYSNVLSTLTPCPPTPSRLSSVPPEERWGMDVQGRCDISGTVEDGG